MRAGAGRPVRPPRAGRPASAADLHETGDPELGGGISSDLSDLVRDAAGALVDHLWHPYRKPWAARALKESREREAGVRKETDDDYRVQWEPMPF